MILYVDKDEVGVLFDLLPMLMDLIPEGGNMGMLVQMLETLIPGLMSSEVFELGIILQKEYSAEIPENPVTTAGLCFSNYGLYHKNMELLTKMLKK